ncbi:transcription factor atf21 [Colletotrichum sojae]|uniref:Transcription factor atf21 n=1 Tax=Colletotrichum sojae TaxID=2175907 RepID=A0A8H6JPQ9_9PEZI|nr:transcription factor atf21 [Colletotrichum sojae]
MDFGPVGVSTLQSGLPSNAFPELFPNLFAVSTGEQTLQQHQDRSQGYQKQRDAQEEQARYFLRQNLQQASSQPASLEQPQQPGFVTLSALSSAPAAPSFAAATSESPSSAASAWQNSPASNPLSPPTSNSSVSPPVDPAILNSPVQDVKVQAVGTKPAGNAEVPSRRRGRPRLSEASAASQAKTKTQNKKKPTTIAAAARRASDASSASDDQHPRAAGGGGGGGPDEKRDRVRARNREAAYKCRKKKQKGIAELQSQEAVVEGIHRNLTAEASMLRGEILMLKNMVLQHGGCGCSYIEEYISGAAQNLVQSSMAAAAAASSSSSSSAPARGGEAGFDFNTNQPPRAGSEGLVDWKTFDVESRNGMSAFGSESGFSALDDVSVTHSSRAQSQGAMTM